MHINHLEKKGDFNLDIGAIMPPRLNYLKTLSSLESYNFDTIKNITMTKKFKDIKNGETFLETKDYFVYTTPVKNLTGFNLTILNRNDSKEKSFELFNSIPEIKDFMFLGMDEEFYKKDEQTLVVKLQYLKTDTISYKQFKLAIINLDKCTLDILDERLFNYGSKVELIDKSLYVLSSDSLNVINLETNYKRSIPVDLNKISKLSYYTAFFEKSDHEIYVYLKRHGDSRTIFKVKIYLKDYKQTINTISLQEELHDLVSVITGNEKQYLIFRKHCTGKSRCVLYEHKIIH